MRDADGAVFAVSESQHDAENPPSHPPQQAAVGVALLRRTVSRSPQEIESFVPLLCVERYSESKGFK